jgi:hypothetical protein
MIVCHFVRYERNAMFQIVWYMNIGTARFPGWIPQGYIDTIRVLCSGKADLKVPAF